MTITDFNEKGFILFMIYYRDNGHHIIKFDYTNQTMKDEINKEPHKIESFYGGLPDNEFNALLKGKSREEAIHEMIISSLNHSNLFSEKINTDSLEKITYRFFDKAKKIN
ncbi:hypothetical protein [Tenacibaculum singaporense]|uniref:Uncharacterized protein n=1 Tax=Tenacibaculum singaporense TaxID=2358479 RepID=A0A3S8R9Q4_9FLAO|nr:hypothetical protein [Tenacibaculum singaporense]AZJ36508.1 hypothetical protein D6T69_13635 [Tenacibaculum singaporense]